MVKVEGTLTRKLTRSVARGCSHQIHFHLAVPQHGDNDQPHHGKRYAGVQQKRPTPITDATGVTDVSGAMVNVLTPIVNHLRRSCHNSDECRQSWCTVVTKS